MFLINSSVSADESACVSAARSECVVRPRTEWWRSYLGGGGVALGWRWGESWPRAEWEKGKTLVQRGRQLLLLLCVGEVVV